MKPGNPRDTTAVEIVFRSVLSIGNSGLVTLMSLSRFAHDLENNNNGADASSGFVVV